MEIVKGFVCPEFIKDRDHVGRIYVEEIPPESIRLEAVVKRKQIAFDRWQDGVVQIDVPADLIGQTVDIIVMRRKG